MLKHGGQPETSGRVEQCKRDYEKEIAFFKEEKEKAHTLFHSILEYVGYGRVGERLAEMIGELFMEIRTHDHRIDSLIEEWQNQKQKED